MVIVGVMNIISGSMGAPFMSPAVVRTITHASSLTIVDTKVAPGEPPKIIGAVGWYSILALILYQ